MSTSLPAQRTVIPRRVRPLKLAALSILGAGTVLAAGLYLYQEFSSPEQGTTSQSIAGLQLSPELLEKMSPAERAQFIKLFTGEASATKLTGAPAPEAPKQPVATATAGAAAPTPSAPEEASPRGESSASTPAAAPPPPPAPKPRATRRTRSRPTRAKSTRSQSTRRTSAAKRTRRAPPPPPPSSSGPSALRRLRAKRNASGSSSSSSRSNRSSSSSLPAQLSPADIKSAMGRQKGAFARCGGGSYSGKVKIKLAVAPSGSVKQVAVQSGLPNRVSSCVKRAARGARFRKTQRGRTFSYRVTVR